MIPPADPTRSPAHEHGPLIGLLGGSFDPVHLGHLVMAERARDQVPCDEIWFVPAAIAPHKPQGAHASAQDRLHMLERALAGRRDLRIESTELEAGTPRRTVQTLRLLAARHPHVRWCLVIGEDTWAEIDTWVEPEAILRLAPAVVQARPGPRRPEPALARAYPALWLEGDPVDVASTGVREALARGETPARLPPAVLDYIRTHGLYRGRTAGGDA